MKKGWCRISTAEGDERGLFEVSARHQSRPGRIVKLPLFYQKSPPLSLSLCGGKREKENLPGAPVDEQSVFERKEVLKKERERVERHCFLWSRELDFKVVRSESWWCQVPLWVKEKRAAQLFIYSHFCISIAASLQMPKGIMLMRHSPLE